MTDDIIKALRRIAKVQYGATVDEAREVSKTLSDAADLITRLLSLVDGEKAQMKLIEQGRFKAEREVAHLQFMLDAFVAAGHIRQDQVEAAREIADTALGREES